MPNLYFMGDVCKRCVMSCNKKLFLVDSSVGIMVKREHRHFLFMKLGMCLCPGLSRHINLALDLFALQRLKYYFQFFHEIPLQIERTSIYIDLFDKYICHWFNSICFASPLSHYEMLSSCFIMYRNLRS